jgi:hypothetical protein
MLRIFKGLLVLAVEMVSDEDVPSTIYKAALAALIQLRAFRCRDTSVTTTSALVLPTHSLASHAYVVTVQWENFSFVVSSECVPSQDEDLGDDPTAPKTRDRIRQAIEARVQQLCQQQIDLVSQILTAPRAPPSGDLVYTVIQLSPDELKMFSDHALAPGSAKQLPSIGSLLVEAGNTIYKRPCLLVDAAGVSKAEKLSQRHANSDPSHLPFIPSTSHVISEADFFASARAQFGPLSVRKVRRGGFARRLVTAIAVALKQLHRMGLAHLDVRWPNVTFELDGAGNLVARFIDMDRCERVAGRTPRNHYGELHR